MVHVNILLNDMSQSQFREASLRHSEVLSVLVPDSENLIAELACAWIPVSIRVDYGLEALRVKHWLDGSLGVPHQVVVQLQPARLLLLNHDFADIQEEPLDLRVVRPELGGQVDGTS